MVKIFKTRSFSAFKTGDAKVKNLVVLYKIPLLMKPQQILERCACQAIKKL